MIRNQRQSERTYLSLPVFMSFSSEITVKGELRDISPRSAFIKMKSSIYMEANDELSFQIKLSPNGSEAFIQGSAYVSRIATGEGIAIYFTKMDEESSRHLQQLVKTGPTGF